MCGGGGGGGCRFDCGMMAPLRDGDPLVFMNEPSLVGWSVMALRTDVRTDGKRSPATPSCFPPSRRCMTTLDYSYTSNDASVTHKTRFCGKCHG